MNNRFLSLVCFLCLVSFASFAQTGLDLKEIRLDNGLRVFLNEDNNVSEVTGAVLIKTGGKYDPAHATGTSHYLEHMLFKGTEIIGTTNYFEEKQYLDSITVLYDVLAKKTENEERDSIQKEINRLSLIAGQYAIPNELSKLLEEIGSTMINAFTSEEIVAYFNNFPANQMEAWLTIYSHRFQNPVFRLFQSELETVFEEKNMYDDNFIFNVIEQFYENLYKNHPYGKQTILGSHDHIRNPSLSTMQEMFDTYYVANNMALLLSGNFNADEVIPLIEEHFGVWEAGEVPEFPEFPEEEFDGVEMVEKRLTPVRIGLKGFRTVPTNHPDRIPLEVATQILSNSYSTGYLDQLVVDNSLVEVMAMNDIRQDHGALVVLYIPKILFQSFNRAERLVHEQILRLRDADIDSTFFEAVKRGMIKQHSQSLENMFDRIFLIAEVFYADRDWDDIVRYPEKIQAVTIEDVQKVAEKYLGDNYLSFRSRMGFPSKNRLEKPGFDPVIPSNPDARSKFAYYIDEIKSEEVKPEFICFDTDLKIENINGDNKLYYAKFETNDIFNVKIKFQSGKFHNPKYEQLAQYLSLIGTKDQSFTEFYASLQSYACNFYAEASDDFFIINISGLNDYLDESLELIAELINNPEPDRSKLRNLRQTASITRRFESRSPDDVSRALINYGIYEENSQFIRRLSGRELRRLKCDDLIELLQETTSLPYSVHYSGALDFNQVNNTVKKHFNFETGDNRNQVPVIIPKKKYAENTILFIHDSDAIQSSIYFYILGKKNDMRERAVINAYNSYFGRGMSSLVFQEIREFRSLAYSAYGIYRTGTVLEDKGHLFAFVGTQSDKTIEAIQIMNELIFDMPHNEERINLIRSSLMQSINSEKPSTREVTNYVESHLIRGQTQDRRITEFETYKELSFNDIINFQETNIKPKSLLITIVGSSENINMGELSEFGNIIELKKKDVLN